MHDEWRRGQALRRGGGTNVEFSIDSGEGETALALPDATTLTPEEVFDRNWANILLKQTLVRLREKFEKKGRIADYEAMLPFLAVSTEPSYAETAKEMGRSIESTSERNSRTLLLTEQISRKSFGVFSKHSAGVRRKDVQFRRRSLQSVRRQYASTPLAQCSTLLSTSSIVVSPVATLLQP